MRIAFCDDNKEWLGTETQYLKRIQGIQISCDAFSCGEDLLTAYENRGSIYDAVFLDMEMKNMDGISTAKKIRESDRHVLIIFVTSYRKYMQESFECMPFRFLVKPIEFEEFETLILKIVKMIEDDKRALVFSDGRDTLRVIYEDIIFIKSEGHYIYIQTPKELYTTLSFKMTEMLERLDDKRFVKIHKSYIVNISYIRRVSGGLIYLNDFPFNLPVSKPYINSLKKQMILFEERKYLL